jgi:hypothetical protein
VRERFQGMGPFAAVAAILFVVGVLAVLLELQSPSMVLWTGIKVQGTTQNGLTYYTYGNGSYAIDNSKADAGDARKRPTTVWLSHSDPTDSSKAYIENAYNRWLDFSFTTMWFILAFLVLAAGFIRRQLRLRRRIETMGEFGRGISDELIRRQLRARNQPVPPIVFDRDE